MDLYRTLAGGFAEHRNEAWILRDDGPTISYGDVDEASARVVGLLRALGVRRGDRVATQVDKSPEALLVYLGVVRAGASFLPLNPAYRPDELAYFLGDAEPAVVIGRSGDEACAEVARRAGVPHVFELDAHSRGSWASAVAGAEALDGAASASDDVAAIVYTSGTTGRSKGAMLTHENLVSNALTLRRMWGFVPGDVLLHALPIFHVHGLFVATNTAMANASPIVFHARFDAAAVVDALTRATVFMGVPTMYTRLLSRPELTRERCAAMRLFVSGSAPLLPETFEQFRERTGHTILERYGMTETSMITSNPCHGPRKGGTVGPPLPGVTVRVVTDDGAAAPAGRVGDVQVKGPNVLKGYWRRPDIDAEEFTADGFFRTGDIGLFDDDHYLTLVGRSKDLVISGGYNVYPKEVELLLDELDGVVESAVIGLAHPDYGEAVTAVLVLEPGATIDEATVVRALKPHLASYKVPKAVRVVAELPRNAMGKVQKNVLRARFASLFAGDDEHGTIAPHEG